MDRPEPTPHRRTGAGGDTPPLVLVPGIDGTGLLFYRQVPLLSRAFDVVTFPLPTDPDLTMADHVEQLRRRVLEISDQGAILVGESFGGALSLSMALAHPGMVRGLVIVNSFPRLASRAQVWLGPVLLRALPEMAMPTVRRLTGPKLHSSHTSPRDRAEFQARSRAIDRRSYIRRVEILRRYDIRHQLEAITAPTLFLAADQDRLVPSVRWGRFMAQRVPHSTLTVLEGYGHVCLINHELDLLDHIGPWWEAMGGASLV